MEKENREKIHLKDNILSRKSNESDGEDTIKVNYNYQQSFSASAEYDRDEKQKDSSINSSKKPSKVTTDVRSSKVSKNSLEKDSLLINIRRNSNTSLEHNNEEIFKITKTNKEPKDIRPELDNSIPALIQYPGNNSEQNVERINSFGAVKLPVREEKSNRSEEQADYVIQLRNIHKTYLIGIEGVPALRGVNISVKKGDFLIILGQSGGGKTTLLNILGTIDAPSRGDMKVFENTIRSNTSDRVLSYIRLKEIAFVFQSFNLLPNMNVVENVELPMKILGKESSEFIRNRALKLLDRVGLSKRLWHFPNQLSGGEQQRVTIARALANSPKILLLDEPTGDLDTKNSDIVMGILMELNLKENITMIMVTHDVGLKNFGTRVIRMLDGKISHNFSIDPSDRKICIDKLNERLINKSQGIREGGLGSGTSGTKKTYVRKLEDYKILKLNKN